MSAAAIKGILLSVALVAAIGIAVLEDPQVQEWLEQQRKCLTELLRSLGEELDPASRRAAEAFAFEGRTPANDPALQREASGSRDATAFATGRSLSGVSAEQLNGRKIYNIPVQGPVDPAEAEERKRKGKEYLAKRNQQMFELRQRKKSNHEAGPSTTPLTPTSFDQMLDADGNLRMAEDAIEFPPVTNADLNVGNKGKAIEIAETSTSQPLSINAMSSEYNPWQLGSNVANPFGDEYALDRSETPKPPRPPKTELDASEDRSTTPQPVQRSMPGSFGPNEPNDMPYTTATNYEPLSYDEELAIALSLSEAEGVANSPVDTRDHDAQHEADLKAAIAASLRDMENRHNPRTIAGSMAAGNARRFEFQPLIDLSTVDTPNNLGVASAPRDLNGTILQPQPRLLPQLPSLAASEADTDELYHISPQLAPAYPSIAQSIDLRSQTVPNSAARYEEEVASTQQMENTEDMDTQLVSSLHSAQENMASDTSDTRSATMELLDLESAGQSAELQRTGSPTTTSSTETLGFLSDSDGESDVFASVLDHRSRASSRPRSEFSNVEVLDVVEDSDMDVLSEDGFSAATPDSWTEVGSQDGDSETDEPQTCSGSNSRSSTH